jgi:hypothetical protein
VLKDKKGMNLPGSALSVPALTEKDKKDIVFGRELGVDWFALSFVRNPSDVEEAKALSGRDPHHRQDREARGREQPGSDSRNRRRCDGGPRGPGRRGRA